MEAIVVPSGDESTEAERHDKTGPRMEDRQ